MTIFLSPTNTSVQISVSSDAITALVDRAFALFWPEEELPEEELPVVPEVPELDFNWLFPVLLEIT